MTPSSSPTPDSPVTSYSLTASSPPDSPTARCYLQIHHWLNPIPLHPWLTADSSLTHTRGQRTSTHYKAMSNAMSLLLVLLCNKEYVRKAKPTLLRSVNQSLPPNNLCSPPPSINCALIHFCSRPSPTHPSAVLMNNTVNDTRGMVNNPRYITTTM